MTHRDDRDAKFRHLLLSTSAAMAFAVAAPGAFAQVEGDDRDTAVPDATQTSDFTDEDEIVVTGIRAALANAADLKRNADTAVDSITASDVSALPDLSVGEALARIPGVVVQRVSLNERLGGDFPSPEGGGNLVRGLQLVRSEINGREAFSANQGRALDFGTIPPELVGGVDVYKNTSADLVEGGIGGSINLRTLEPFDRTGLFAVATADAVYTDLRDDVTPELSILVSNRWETGGGEVGLLGSLSYSELNSDLNGFQIGQLVPLPINGENVAVPAGVQLRTNEVDRVRDSAYLVGQYENNAGTFQATAKFISVNNEQEGDERTVEWFGTGETFSFDGDGNLTGNNYEFPNGITTTPFTSSGLPICNGANTGPGNCEQTLPVTALYESGLISNNLRDWTGSEGANFSTLGINQLDKSSVEDISLNLKFKVADNIFVNLDGHRTTAEASRERIWAGTNFFANFEIVPDIDDPQVRIVGTEGWSFNNPSWVRGDDNLARSGAVNDPRSSFYLFNADQFQDNDGELYSFAGDVEYEFEDEGWFDSVKFGARYSERDQTNRSTQLNWASVAAPWNGGYSPFDVNQAGFERVDFSDFHRGDVVVGDATEFLFVNRTLIRNYQQLQGVINNDPTLGADWTPFGSSFEDIDYVNTPNTQLGTIEEQTINAYGRLDFGYEFSNGMSLDANVGVRYTTSDVSSIGTADFRDEQPTDPNVRLPDQTDEEFARQQRGALENFIPEALAFSQQGRILTEGDVDGEDFWLPSFNAKLNVSDELLFRAGVSKNITRPTLSQLNPVRTASVSTTRVVGDEGTPLQGETLDVFASRISFGDPTFAGGNPALNPIEAWNYDISAEYYWDNQNSFTLSLFRKDISENIVYATVPLAPTLLDGVEVPTFFTGLVNQDEADLQGVEVAYQQFYDFLPGLLGNLGLQANYTYIDAEATPPNPFVDTDGDGASDNFENDFRYGVDNFLGLSKHTANVVGIFQSDDLELRLAYNWRSRYLGDYREFISGNPIFQDDRGYLDGSVKWDLNDALQFRVQAANLLNTNAIALQQIDADGQFFGRTNFIQDRRVKVGFRYQFN